MCRMLFAFRRQTAAHVARRLRELEAPYRRFCDDDRVSFGVYAVAAAAPRRFAALPCSGRVTDLTADLAPSSHFMVHLRKRGKGAASAPENAHPFVWLDRYVFMHNGVIPTAYALPAAAEARIQGQTDSERFLALWMTAAPGLLDGLRAAMATVVALGRPLLNVVLLDTATGEFVAYRYAPGRGRLPALWVGDDGCITNYRPTEGAATRLATGHVLHRPRWGARATARAL